MSLVSLGELIELKYGKPISQNDRDNNGKNFIYGANGVLGRTNNFLIEGEALIIGRKGSAGFVNRVSGKFWPSDVTYYVLGNESFDIDYLYFLLKYLELPKLARGVKPGLNRNDVYEIKIPLPSLRDQKATSFTLKKMNDLIQKRNEALSLLDDYINSVFLDMFGNPESNNKNWERKPINNFGEIITGNTPSRNDQSNYFPEHIEWIKTDNIIANKIFLTKASEYLSEKGLKKARKVTHGALLVACIAGSIESIGRAALTDRHVSFNQQINAIQPNSSVNSIFLYWLFKLSKKYIQSHATKGMKKILTKGEFEKIVMIKPPIEFQNKFATIAHDIECLKQKMLIQSEDLDNQFQSLMQKFFSTI